MTNLLIDTDVFIDHLRGARALALDSDTVSYSVVTRCELFAGTKVNEDALHILLAPFRELAVDRTVAERAGRIRRETGTRIADALIAATALEHDLTLVSRNARDFGLVQGLTIQVPG